MAEGLSERIERLKRQRREVYTELCVRAPWTDEEYRRLLSDHARLNRELGEALAIVRLMVAEGLDTE